MGNFINVKVGEKLYKMRHLISEEEKEQGLMGVKSLPKNQGALFDYSDSPQESISFWMHDTLIPLDICFVNENKTVISVHEGVPNTDDEITEDSEFVAYVIEVNSNSGIKPGDKVLIESEEHEFDEEEDLEDEYPELKVNHLVIYGSDGKPQGYLKGNERIFSRKSTVVILRKAKRAYKSQSDVDFKSLGRYVFKEMQAQDNRPEEFV